LREAAALAAALVNEIAGLAKQAADRIDYRAKLALGWSS
jgi:hypothetical protein